MKYIKHILLSFGAICAGLFVSAPFAQAQFAIPAEFDFGTGTGQDDLTGFDQDTIRADIALTSDGVNISRDPNQSSSAGRVSSEFSPLSSQNQDFEMSATILFNNSFERNWQRTGLIGFGDPTAATFKQGLGFALIRDGNGDTQIGFQTVAAGDNAAGGVDFDLVAKSGLQAGSLAGNTLNFHVDGDWDATASEWDFTLTVTDPDNTATIASTTIDPASPPQSDLMTGTQFGFFGFGPNSNDAADVTLDVTVETFEVIPEPSNAAGILGAAAMLFLLTRRRVLR